MKLREQMLAESIKNAGRMREFRTPLGTLVLLPENKDAAIRAVKGSLSFKMPKPANFNTSDAGVVERLLKPFTRKHHKYPVLGNVHHSGRESVATCGATLACVINTGFPKSDLEGYPDYPQVVPGYREADVPEVDDYPLQPVAVVEAALWQAMAANKMLRYRSDVSHSYAYAFYGNRGCTFSYGTAMMCNPDGLYDEDQDCIVGNGCAGKTFYTCFNLDKLIIALRFMYDTGNATFAMHMPTSRSPCILIGDRRNAYVLVMPMTHDGLGERKEVVVLAHRERGEVAPNNLRLEVPYDIEVHNGRTVFKYRHLSGRVAYYLQCLDNAGRELEGYRTILDREYPRFEDAIAGALAGDECEFDKFHK